jgi:Ku70/Ku80 beta-barrel domain
VWAVTVSFGLVNVPVSLVAASRDLDLHFRQLHEQDGAPIDVQRWCSKENIQIPYEEITNGYELDDGDQVIVSDLELEAIEPRRTRTIDIEQFVDLADVDPMYARQTGDARQGIPRRRGFYIGAPGFEPGDSPTRIMGEIRPAHGKALQIACCGSPAPPSSPRILPWFPGV